MGTCYGRLGGSGRRRGFVEGGADGAGAEERGGRRPCPGQVPVKTQPLKQDLVKWRSELPITMGQLNSKRDEFWETAPVFEGRREIWDAIKAAVAATEESDFALAQAILDGANIYIPHGTLGEAFDELGNRYKVPIYCLSRPLNILCEEYEGSSGQEDGVPFVEEDLSCSSDDDHVLKLRLSSTGKDVDLKIRKGQSVSACKARLGSKLACGMRQRWFYGGKLLEDKVSISDLAIPHDHVIQVVFLHVENGNLNGTVGSKKLSPSKDPPSS